MNRDTLMEHSMICDIEELIEMQVNDVLLFIIIISSRGITVQVKIRSPSAR